MSSEINQFELTNPVTQEEVSHAETWPNSTIKDQLRMSEKRASYLGKRLEISQPVRIKLLLPKLMELCKEDKESCQQDIHSPLQKMPDLSFESDSKILGSTEKFLSQPKGSLLRSRSREDNSSPMSWLREPKSACKKLETGQIRNNEATPLFSRSVMKPKAQHPLFSIPANHVPPSNSTMLCPSRDGRSLFSKLGAKSIHSTPHYLDLRPTKNISYSTPYKDNEKENEIMSTKCNSNYKITPLHVTREETHGSKNLQHRVILSISDSENLPQNVKKPTYHAHQNLQHVETQCNSNYENTQHSVKKKIYYAHQNLHAVREHNSNSDYTPQSIKKEANDIHQNLERAGKLSISPPTFEMIADVNEEYKLRNEVNDNLSRIAAAGGTPDAVPVIHTCSVVASLDELSPETPKALIHMTSDPPPVPFSETPQQRIMELHQAMSPPPATGQNNPVKTLTMNSEGQKNPVKTLTMNSEGQNNPVKTLTMNSEGQNNPVKTLTMNSEGQKNPVKTLTMNSEGQKNPVKTLTMNSEGQNNPVKTLTMNSEGQKNPVKTLTLNTKRHTKTVKNLRINTKTYTVLSFLGKGGSSQVYQVLDPESAQLLAVKCVNLSNTDEHIARGYLNEINLLLQLQDCDSIIKLFDSQYLPEKEVLYVVMEKGDTDLSRLVQEITRTKKMSIPMVVYYWTEILNAVKNIHERGIIHSDLKPANFLLVSGRLKLIDFGIASSLQTDMTSVIKDSPMGTFNYMSPEAIKESCHSSFNGKNKIRINYKSDVWSLGCILYNLVYGRTPFQHIKTTWGKLAAITNPEHHIEFPPLEGCPAVLLVAMKLCLAYDSKLRPTAAELLLLPYIEGGTEEDILTSTLPPHHWLSVSKVHKHCAIMETGLKLG